MKQLILFIVWTMLIYTFGAITKEMSIYRCLKEYGHARSSAWFYEIYSPQMMTKKETK